MSFLFSGLGMMIFWGFYVLFGLVVFTCTARILFQDLMDLILGKQTYWGENDYCAAFLAILVFFFWPVFLSFVIMFFAVKLLLMVCKYTIIMANKIIPEIEIKKKDD